LYPHQHGITQGFYAHEGAMFASQDTGGAAIPLNALPNQVTTLPELFQTAGYATFGISGNRNVGPEMGFDRGFDRFMVESDRTADVMYRRLRLWMRDIRGKTPYFVYLHLMDPHAPYYENKPYFSRYMHDYETTRAQYLSEVSFADHWLERVFKLFCAEDNTLLYMMSDHGEEFGDHGHTGHGAYLYNELNQVLMMVYGPECGIEAGRYDQNVSLLDVMPTLAEFIGLPAPPEAMGASLLPMMSEGAGSSNDEFWNRRVLLGHRAFPSPPYPDNWSAARGRWKYVEHYRLVPELFDHAEDPREQHNVAEANSDLVTELAGAIAAARGAPRQFSGEAVEVPVDEELFEELRSLGYTN